MAPQSISEFDDKVDSESRYRFSIRSENFHSTGAGSLPLTLTAARVLFSTVLLDSTINWNDLKWTEVHFFALVPFIWAVATIILWMFGYFRWKSAGRWMALTDLAICAATIVFFPTYMLPALALAFLVCTFLVLRHDGRFAAFLAAMPLSAMLVHPLSLALASRMIFPAHYLIIGAGGQITAFVLSFLVVIFSILIIIRVRLLEQPLTFEQPWEEEFSISVGKHNIAPVIDRVSKLYPSSQAVCVLNSAKSSEGVSIVTSSSFEPVDITPIRSQVSEIGEQISTPQILLLEEQYGIDVATGEVRDITPSLNAFLQGMKTLGFTNGVLIDFELCHIRGRLFFSTGTSVDEALRNDVAVLQQQMDSYFKYAAKWELRRQKMISVARDLARRDLHDGVLQSLAALKMRLVTIAAGPAFSESPDVEVLRKTVDIITVEQARLRALLHDDEDYVDAIDLIKAVEVCLQTLSLQWEITAKLVSSEPALPVDRESADNIEFLIREAIANAIRHAGAKQLTLTLALDKGDLMITLRDDQSQEKMVNSESAAKSILKSRSLLQRLLLVNGRAYSENLEDSTLLAIGIPMDFTTNA